MDSRSKINKTTADSDYRVAGRFIGLVATSYQSPVASDTTGKKEGAQDRAAGKTATATVVIALLTFAAVAVSVLTCFVLFRQLKEMRATREGEDISTKAQLRIIQTQANTAQASQGPLILLFSINFRQVLVSADPKVAALQPKYYEVDVGLKNFGTTATKNLSFAAWWYEGAFSPKRMLPDTEKAIDVDWIAAPKQRYILAAGQEVHYSPAGSYSPDAVTIDEMLKSSPPVLKNTSSRLSFLVGRAVYKDRFGEDALHISEFCLQVSQIGLDGSGLAEQPKISPCRRHTCVDAECAEQEKEDAAEDAPVYLPGWQESVERIEKRQHVTSTPPH